MGKDRLLIDKGDNIIQTMDRFNASFESAMDQGKRILNPVSTRTKVNSKYAYKCVNRNNKTAIIFVGTRKHLTFEQKFDNLEHMNLNYVTQRLKENGFDGYP